MRSRMIHSFGKDGYFGAHLFYVQDYQCYSANRRGRGLHRYSAKDQSGRLLRNSAEPASARKRALNTIALSALICTQRDSAKTRTRYSANSATRQCYSAKRYPHSRAIARTRVRCNSANANRYSAEARSAHSAQALNVHSPGYVKRLCPPL